jgi:hypothetical protein
MANRWQGLCSRFTPVNLRTVRPVMLCWDLWFLTDDTIERDLIARRPSVLLATCSALSLRQCYVPTAISGHPAECVGT